MLQNVLFTMENIDSFHTDMCKHSQCIDQHKNIAGTMQLNGTANHLAAKQTEPPNQDFTNR